MLVGWPPVAAALLEGGGIMGRAPEPGNFDRRNSIAVMVLSPFATSSAGRPEIDVRITGGTARIDARERPPGIGLAVLNHPFWIGVFSAGCAFDLRLPAPAR